jgi:hypothetical protein
MRAQASKERMGFLVFDAVDLQCPWPFPPVALRLPVRHCDSGRASDRLLRVFVSNCRQMDRRGFRKLSPRFAMHALARTRAERARPQSARRIGVRLYQSELFVAGFGYLSDGGVSMGHLDPRLRM